MARAAALHGKGGSAAAGVARVLFFLSLLALSTSSAASQSPGQPRVLKRLHQVTSGKQEGRRYLPELPSVGSLKPDAEVEELLRVANGGKLDPMDLLKQVAGAEGFKEILKDENTMGKILEQFPLLSVFDGFKTAREATSRDEMADAFQEGLNTLLSFTQNTMKNIKDPNNIATAVNDLLSSDDDETQELVSNAGQGDLPSMLQLRDKLNARLVPGVDLDGFRDVINDYDLSKLLDFDEVMPFLDQDSVISTMIREPQFNKQDLLDFIN